LDLPRKKGKKKSRGETILADTSDRFRGRKKKESARRGTCRPRRKEKGEKDRPALFRLGGREDR